MLFQDCRQSDGIGFGERNTFDPFIVVLFDGDQDGEFHSGWLRGSLGSRSQFHELDIELAA